MKSLILLILFTACNYHSLSIAPKSAVVLGNNNIPFVSLSTPAQVSALNVSGYSLNGTCVYRGGDVTISDGASINSTVACSVLGTFSFTMDLSAFPEGTINFTITQTNDDEAQYVLGQSVLKDSERCDGTPFGTGDGSSGNPYVVCTVAHWNAINAATLATPALYFEIGADIDFTAQTVTPINTCFSCQIDGQGFELQNINLIGNGLITSMNNGSVIDLKVDNMTLYATTGSSGLIASSAFGTSLVSDLVITNSTLTKDASFTTANSFGGVFGSTLGTARVVSSSIDVTIAGDAAPALALMNSVGGVVGQSLSTGVYDDIVVTGEVRGSESVGGAFGTFRGLSAGMIRVTGDVICSADHCGGIAGEYDSSGSRAVLVDNSSFTGNIQNNDLVADTDRNYGGIFGNVGNATIERTVASGTLSGSVTFEKVGGIVGEVIANTVVRECAVDMVISGAAMYFVGGFVSNVAAGNLSIENSYAAGSVTAQQDVAGMVLTKAGGSTVDLSYTISAMSLSTTAGSLAWTSAVASACVTSCFRNIDFGGAGADAYSSQLDSTNLNLEVGATLDSLIWKTSTYPILIWQ
jgi:hypothetical protein